MLYNVYNNLHWLIMSVLGEIFSDRLRQALNEQGISIRGFAKSMGVSPSTAQNWVQGQPPVHTTIDEITELLELSPGWLIGLENTPPMRDSLVLEGISLLQKIEDIENLEKLVRILRIGLETQEDLKKKRKNKA
jgi:transcriptional regulator with XRE-family HTH domain